MQEILILINVIILIYTIKKTGGASPAGIELKMPALGCLSTPKQEIGKRGME